MNENEKYADIERRAAASAETAQAIRIGYALGDGDARRIDNTVADVAYLLQRLRFIEDAVSS